MGKITIEYINPRLHDRLHTLALEYAVSIDLLTNVAIKQFLDNVDLLRDIRAGKIKLE